MRVGKFRRVRREVGRVSSVGGASGDPTRCDEAATDGAPVVLWLGRVSDSVRSLKMVQRMRRVQREVSLAPQGVLPPRDS